MAILVVIAMAEHTDDLRNVNKGDDVEITTTADRTFEAKCVFQDKQHADPRSGEVRETNIWRFEVGDREIAATITDGLRSSPNDPEFPQHNELWDMREEENMGYIENVRIFGEIDS